MKRYVVCVYLADRSYYSWSNSPANNPAQCMNLLVDHRFFVDINTILKIVQSFLGSRVGVRTP